MTSVRSLLVVVSALLSLAVTCESDLIEDPGFQLWCGQRLCAWDLEQGEIRKVSTWHTNDYGVDLVGSPVLLSSPALRGSSSVRVEVVSKIQNGARVTVEIDQDGNGTIDWSQAVPPSDDFVSRSWIASGRLEGSGVYYVRKSGEGEAVIARLLVAR